jgi:hypothetical protein
MSMTRMAAAAALLLAVPAGAPRPAGHEGTSGSTIEIPFQLTTLALDLGVDYAHNTIAGTATLTVRNVSKQAAATVPLLLNRLMTVARVSDAAGAAVPFAQRFALLADDSSWQLNALTVRPERPVAPGGSITLTVQYSGTLVGYVETGSLYIRDHVDSAFTIIREDAYAFPVLGVLSSQANRAAPRGPFTFAARVTVPAGQVVAMGGEGQDPVRHDSLVTWSYHSTMPVPFLNITIAPYRVMSSTGSKIFYFAADSDGARMVEHAIHGAMTDLAAWFGPMGHTATLTVMEIPNGFGSQASFSAGILQTAAAFHDVTEMPQLYHELSHLWNVEDLERPSPRWNEGLAMFLQYRMAAELDGWHNWDKVLDWFVATLKRECAGPARCDSVPFASYGTAGMTDDSYSVGMLMFYTLYQVMGAERFDRAYRDFYQGHREGGGSTAQLAAAFTAADPASGPVLHDWLLTTRWYARLKAGESLPQMIEGYKAH